MGIEVLPDPAAIFAPGSVSLKIVVGEAKSPGAFCERSGPLPCFQGESACLPPLFGFLHEEHSSQRLPEDGVVKLPGRLETGGQSGLLLWRYRQWKFKDEGLSLLKADCAFHRGIIRSMLRITKPVAAHPMDESRGLRGILGQILEEGVLERMQENPYMAERQGFEPWVGF